MKILKRILLCTYVIGIMLLLTGCTSADTGAFHGGTIYYSDYKINIEGPQVGAPSGEALWSTYYTDDNGVDTMVDIYGKEGSLAERIEELTNEGKVVSKGVLWQNNCYFYINEATIAMIPLDEDAYLQVEIIREDDLVESMRVPGTFVLTIEKK